MEAVKGTALTGLFGYMIRKSVAEELLADGSIFPLSLQIDIALSRRVWPSMTRFALGPEQVLLTAPRSEEGQRDTDVQTLGALGVEVHANLPHGMLSI